MKTIWTPYFISVLFLTFETCTTCPDTTVVQMEHLDILMIEVLWIKPQVWDCHHMIWWYCILYPHCLHCLQQVDCKPSTDCVTSTSGQDMDAVWFPDIRAWLSLDVIRHQTAGTSDVHLLTLWRDVTARMVTWNSWHSWHSSGSLSPSRRDDGLGWLSLLFGPWPQRRTSNWAQTMKPLVDLLPIRKFFRYRIAMAAMGARKWGNG